MSNVYKTLSDYNGRTIKIRLNKTLSKYTIIYQNIKYKTLPLTSTALLEYKYFKLYQWVRLLNTTTCYKYNKPTKPVKPKTQTKLKTQAD